MARWKLMVSHYLNVEGEEWEYNETDRKTGKMKRTRFPVPRYLDINDPSCWTSKWGVKGDEEGEIIVCQPGKGEPGDIEFHGDPTPDMLPLDDEAKAISASFEVRWSYKPDGSDVTHSQSLVDRFQVEMAEAQAKPIEVPGLAELTAAIGRMADQNQKIVESMSRRV